MAPKKKVMTKDALRKRNERPIEKPKQRIERLHKNNLYKKNKLIEENTQNRSKRLKKNKEYKSSWKQNQSTKSKTRSDKTNKKSVQESKNLMEFEAFNYKANSDYSEMKEIIIGKITKQSEH